MSVRQKDAINSGLGELRREPIAKRIRAEVDGVTVLDTTNAVLVWEPRRLLCEYAVPAAEVRGELVAAQPVDGLPEPPEHGPVFPNIPFAVHTAYGQAFDVRIGDRTLDNAAYRVDDAELADLVVLDFHAFDAWYQEDEPNIGHPRDPYHRIDTFPSSRRIRVERNGTVLATSTRSMALFEAMLPTRYYLPTADVRVELTPTQTSTACAYKGWASYWSADVDGTTLTDVAWGYLDPLADSERIRGLVCFDDSQVDVIVEAG